MEAEMHSRRSKLSIFGLCGMMCLAVPGPALGAEDRFDGVYTGKATLTKSSNPTCVAYDDVFITIHGKTLKITNSKLPISSLDFTLVQTDHSAKAMSIISKVRL